MNYELEIYPTFTENKDDHIIYYVEFFRHKMSDPLYWILYQRNYICSKEEWNEKSKSIDDFLLFTMSREGHPYQIGNGKVNEIDFCADMNTKKFLKFMVDSLNKNCKPLS